MVKSPCIDVCRISEVHGVCIGCYRTLDEIARWRDMNDDEQRRLLAQLRQRQRELGQLEPDSNTRRER